MMIYDDMMIYDLYDDDIYDDELKNNLSPIVSH